MSDLTKPADWQVITIFPDGVIEVDCKSGARRRIYADGEIEALPDQSIRLLCGDTQRHSLTGETRSCTREQGHAGWHHDKNRTESWTPAKDGKGAKK